MPEPKITGEALAAYKAVYGELVELKRRCSLIGHRLETTRIELEIEHGLEPGKTFDLFGDGSVIEKAKATKPPGV